MEKYAITNHAINDLIKTDSLTSKNVLESKEFLSKEWIPKDMSDAIKMKHLQHLFSHSSPHLSKVCADELDKLEFADSTIIDSVSGLKVLRKRKTLKTPNTNKKTEEIKDQIQDLQYKIEKLIEPYLEEVKLLTVRLEMEQEKIGINSQFDGYTYSVIF